MNKFVAMLLCLAMIVGLAGCTTQKLDQGMQTESQTGTVEAEKQTEPASDPSTEPSETEEEFSVEDVTAETQDLSKYQEKKDKYLTDPVPEGHQKPVEPEDAHIDTTSEKTCYLSITCYTILDNMGDLKDGKEVLVPSDGVILPKTKVTFHDGESVFDVLQRETRNRRIHMDSRFTPMYNSAYIAGIGNLYEFDCGSGSGWNYRVNGWFPNYGVSRYAVQQDDVIEFCYTCDLGRDL